ncbi:hypothetical protein WKI65_43175 [Streptomyces sp. MS1.AVA.3]|uniref:hypothetical protein n=1 Tax=Streptomyces decoyicus TaxID=249567 RepID=UPI0030BC2342
MMRPDALSATVAVALVAGDWAGSAHLLERAEYAVDRWARKHAVRRAFTRRRHVRWWLAQLWFAAQIVCDLVFGPITTVRYIREVRRQRCEFRQPAPSVIVADPGSAGNGQQQGVHQ